MKTLPVKNQLRTTGVFRKVEAVSEKKTGGEKKHNTAVADSILKDIPGG